MAGCKIAGPLCVNDTAANDDSGLSLQRSSDPGTVGSFTQILRLAGALSSVPADSKTVAIQRSLLKLGASPNVYGGDQLGGGVGMERSHIIQALEFDPRTRSLDLTWVAFSDHFGQYATSFELNFSILVQEVPDSGHRAIPVVVSSPEDTFTSSRLLVVGHILTQSGGQFFVPKGVSCDIDLPKEWARGVPIFIARDPTAHEAREESKGTLLWTRAGLSELNYTVMTRVDGTIVSFLSSKASGFIVSEFGPILFIASLLAPLGIALFRTAIASLFVRETGTQLALQGTTNAELQTIARSLLAKQAPGRAVVNLGGTGEVAGAINVNPLLDQQVVGVPNLVATTAENVGEVFPAQSVDSVVSNNIVNGQVNWAAAARGSFRILRPGGLISVAPYAAQLDAQVAAIKGAFEVAGFRRIVVQAGRVVTAVK